MTDARASIHAMFALDATAEKELDARLDALVAEELRAAAADLELRARAGGSRQRGLLFARALLRDRADGITPAAPRRSVRHQDVAKALRAKPGDYCAGLRAGAELLLAKTVEKAGVPAVCPGADTNRRARLLHEMAAGARWKSGDVVRWYETQGLTGLDARAARHDLALLRDSGAITQHDGKGVRFYTVATPNHTKGGSA